MIWADAEVKLCMTETQLDGKETDERPYGLASEQLKWGKALETLSVKLTMCEPRRDEKTLNTGFGTG